MPTFYENDPSLQSYWRAIILYGRNVASFKFALAKVLIDLNKQPNDLIKLDDLADPFSKHLCEHLRRNDRQGTSSSSPFLDACRKYNKNEIKHDQLINITKRIGFKDVIDAFHTVNAKPIPKPFYIDERRTNGGIRITEDFYRLAEFQESENFPSEVEARWRLVETAWKIGISPALLEVKHDKAKEIFFVGSSNNRIDVTSSRDALNGYQKSKCFFCYGYISIISHSPSIAQVDHFFPHKLLNSEQSSGFGHLDGVWNLVLACRECNRGEGGKFAKLPALKLLERLNRRNEYLCSSHHPLRETIIKQTGENEGERRVFLQKVFDEAKDILIHTWEPEPKDIATF